MKNNLNSFLATWFGIGNAPIAPGTFASLLSLPLGYIIHNAFGSLMLGIISMFVFVGGIWITDLYIEMNQSADKDPKEVVIDEVAGQWLMLAFMPPTLFGYALAFLLFRFFDIIKPWPISWLDKNFKNGFGVMVDDIAAAVFGIITYFLINELLLQHITPVFSWEPW